MMKGKDFIPLIVQKLEDSPDCLPRLLRSTGSFVEEVMDLESLKAFFSAIEDFDECSRSELPRGVYSHNCRYYTAPLPEGYNAFVFVTTVCELIRSGQHSSIAIDPENGGAQLVSPDVPRLRTRYVSAITDQSGLRTWYPGKFESKSGGTLLEMTVKGKRS